MQKTFTPLPDDDYNGEPGCLIICIAAAASFLLVASFIGFIHLLTMIIK
jgi:hypothetical protein